MKLKMLTGIVVLLINTVIYAQKFAYIDTEYILEHIPEYKEAQGKLDQYSVQWQSEIEKKYQEIDKLYKSFQAEQILMTEEMKRKKEQEIVLREKDVKEFQKQKFGYQGELFKKKQELIKPIQDKVYDAVQNLAKEKAYAFVFDKSSDLVMIFASPKYDESDKIIIDLGYTPGEKNKKTEQKEEKGGSDIKTDIKNEPLKRE